MAGRLAWPEIAAIAEYLTIRQIQSKISGRASRGFVGEVTKRTRDAQSAPV
jgi:hypothetical protein